MNGSILTFDAVTRTDALFAFADAETVALLPSSFRLPLLTVRFSEYVPGATVDLFLCRRVSEVDRLLDAGGVRENVDLVQLLRADQARVIEEDPMLYVIVDQWCRAGCAGIEIKLRRVNRDRSRCPLSVCIDECRRAG
jgi:hypothetical protein